MWLSLPTVIAYIVGEGAGWFAPAPGASEGLFASVLRQQRNMLITAQSKGEVKDKRIPQRAGGGREGRV